MGKNPGLPAVSGRFSKQKNGKEERGAVRGEEGSVASKITRGGKNDDLLRSRHSRDKGRNLE